MVLVVVRVDVVEGVARVAALILVKLIVEIVVQGNVRVHALITVLVLVTDVVLLLVIRVVLIPAMVDVKKTAHQHVLQLVKILV